jgi:hypothetical protein
MKAETRSLQFNMSQGYSTRNGAIQMPRRVEDMGGAIIQMLLVVLYGQGGRTPHG